MNEMLIFHVCFRDILKVTKVSQLKFVLTEDLVQIGLSRPEQRRYKKIYSKYFPNPYISKIRKMLKPSRKRDQVSASVICVKDSSILYSFNSSRSRDPCIEVFVDHSSLSCHLKYFSRTELLV